MGLMNIGQWFDSKPLNKDLTKTNDRMSSSMSYQRGVDLRSGNLLVNDDEFPRVFLGSQQGTGTDFYGMKISKPGFDVNSATNDELIFNTDYNVFKILEKNTVTLTKLASTFQAEQIIYHSYGVNPIVLAFWTSPTTNVPLPYIDVNSTSGIISENIWCYARSSTNIRFFIETPTASSLYASELTRTITYYLLVETMD